jgi:hypothetical protein
MDPDLPRVISLPRNDNQQNQFVLVRIESMGRKPLDLKLIGTDGESVFSVSGELAIGPIAWPGPWTSFHASIPELIKPSSDSEAQSNRFLEG